MAKYESQIKAVASSQSAVYAKISDLSNLASIKDRIDDPDIQQRIPADKLGEVKRSLEQMECTPDSLSTPVGPIGNVSIQIVEREPEKCVKYTSTNSPVSFKLWIQVLPTSDTTSKIKVTMDADINFFMKQVLDKHLKEGVDKFADMLAMIPY